MDFRHLSTTKTLRRPFPGSLELGELLCMPAIAEVLTENKVRRQLRFNSGETLRLFLDFVWPLLNVRDSLATKLPCRKLEVHKIGKEFSSVQLATTSSTKIERVSKFNIYPMAHFENIATLKCTTSKFRSFLFFFKLFFF